jgi:hypothetical protein
VRPRLQARSGNRTLADHLLPECTETVRLDGRATGTAFYIAPGLLVTCAHVLGKSAASTGNGRITVGNDREAHLQQRWEEQDLALLRLPVSHNHPCVLLDPTLLAGDRTHSFGYPEKHPEGEPTTFEAEGETGPQFGWTKLKGGQAQHGMSGSPVLNVRTGGVSGVLKRTRDDRQALGGYAISARTLFELDPTLQTQNLRFHKHDKSWTNLLTPEQRRLLAPTLGAKPEGEAATVFVVTVRQTAKRWEARAVVYPGEDKLKATAIDLNSVRVEVARVFRDWALRGRVKEAEQIRMLGKILYTALFQGAIRTRFEELLGRRREQPVIAAISFEAETDKDLSQLPWEHAWVPSEGPRGDVYLATDRYLSFERTLHSEPAASDQEEPPQGLSVLVVRADPPRSPGVRDADEVTFVEWVVEKLEANAEDVWGLDVRRLDNPTPEVLGDELEAGSYDVVHYIGFGRFELGARADELVLGSVGGGVDYASIDTLSESLRRGAPKLVVLEFGKVAPDVVPADFTLIAPDLLRQGIPAVVAFQYPVGVKDAEQFNQSLYEALAAGRSVETAVQEGRTKLAVQGTKRPSVSPALFMLRPGPLRLAAPSPGNAETSQPQGAYTTYG